MISCIAALIFSLIFIALFVMMQVKYDLFGEKKVRSVIDGLYPSPRYALPPKTKDEEILDLELEKIQAIAYIKEIELKLKHLKTN